MGSVRVAVMAFSANVLRVLIASPDDTKEERDAVERSLHGWNASRAEREQVVLLPARWETDAVPRLGESGQSVINDQLVDRADIIIALFDSRLGKATDQAVSGTAEEIQRANEAGKPVHVYFSQEPLPRDVDEKQLAALRKFQASLESQSLLGTYASPDDLGFQVRSAVEHNLEHLSLGAVPPRRGVEEHAVLRATYEFERQPTTDNRGRTKYKTQHERIRVTSHGSVTAEKVSIALEPLGDSDIPILHGANVEPDIIATSHYDYPVITFDGSGNVNIVLTWHEGDVEQTVTQALAI
jgi:hypothetical protein